MRQRGEKYDFHARQKSSTSTNTTSIRSKKVRLPHRAKKYDFHTEQKSTTSIQSKEVRLSAIQSKEVRLPYRAKKDDFHTEQRSTTSIQSKKVRRTFCSLHLCSTFRGCHLFNYKKKLFAVVMAFSRRIILFGRSVKGSQRNLKVTVKR